MGLARRKSIKEILREQAKRGKPVVAVTTYQTKDGLVFRVYLQNSDIARGLKLRIGDLIQNQIVAMVGEATNQPGA